MIFWRLLESNPLASQFLHPLGSTVIDYGTIVQPQEDEPEVILNCRNQSTFVTTSLELAATVQRSVSENELTLVLGGDRSVETGSIMGHFGAFPDSFVVWVDAHADIITPDLSKSGNTHNMALSFVIQETNELIPKTNGFEKLIAW